MDMDATIKGISVDENKIEDIINKILSIDIDGNTTGDKIIPKEVDYSF